MSDRILDISNKVKKVRDNNPILDALAGFIPGIGEAQDAHDFYHAAKKGDINNMLLSAAAFFLPLTATQVKGLKKLGYGIVDQVHEKLGRFVIKDGKKYSLGNLIEKDPEIQKLFNQAIDRGYDVETVQRTLKDYLNKQGKLAMDYPGFAKLLDKGFPEAQRTMEKAQKIIEGEGIPTIRGGQPDALSVARAQGQSGEFGLGYHGDAPFVGNKRKYSKSFGGYFFLTQGERAKQAAMAYSHFESPELVLQLSKEAGLPLEVAQRAQKLSERIHKINEELGIKEFKLDGTERATKGFRGDVKFQYENKGLLKEKTRNGESVEKLLNEYAQKGEELTNLFKYTPTGQKIGQIKQYLYKHNSPINTEAIISGSGNYNDIINPKYVKKSGTIEREIKSIKPEEGKYNISTAEKFFGNQGVDKITIQGIANPIPGVTTLGVNPNSTTLIYKKGNKLCRK